MLGSSELLGRPVKRGKGPWHPFYGRPAEGRKEHRLRIVGAPQESAIRRAPGIVIGARKRSSRPQPP